ncbi:hypothetical protein M408DRAFT_221923 [Serendipita vermifera MAFF 305830]|uniref:BTB domain-containing protein n=1 Tax=Serendipita vermifera MAFF 305830 TaxID=933852 RepID=A0A0C3B121_SERVB|nr:hypothetical protein M408DRAFT_221923 [Serendipita vermifera MAFF 305830]
MVHTAPSSSASSPQLPHRYATFEVANGDTLLQSSDSFSFSVHRCLLVRASPAFCDTFHIPPIAIPCSSVVPNLVPIPISEPAYVLDALLRFMYPLPPPSFNDLSQLAPVLAACINYQMAPAISILRQQLVSPKFLLREPLRVFAIARRFGLTAEVAEASRETLRIDLSEAPFYEEMKYISAYDLQCLLVLHRQRGKAARSVLSARSSACRLRCSKCSRDNMGQYTLPPRWWREFERKAKEELTRRPLTDVIFTMRFLSECANAGCSSCGTSLLDSYEFLETLKAEIDALPDALPLTPAGDN